MKKVEMTLFFNENTIKWAKEKSKKQNLDVTTFLISKIENEVYRDYIEGKFEPINYKKENKNEKRKNK